MDKFCNGLGGQTVKTFNTKPRCLVLGNRIALQYFLQFAVEHGTFSSMIYLLVNIVNLHSHAKLPKGNIGVS